MDAGTESCGCDCDWERERAGIHRERGDSSLRAAMLPAVVSWGLLVGGAGCGCDPTRQGDLYRSVVIRIRHRGVPS